MNLVEAVFLTDKMTCKEAIHLMKEKSFDQFPVKCSETNKTLGMVKLNDLSTKLANKKVVLQDSVSLVMNKDYRDMSSEMPVSELARIFERQNFVLVDNKYIVSNYDLLSFMAEKME